jgi:ABC-type siderophore export system fused ATPase/permease subunit
MHHENAVLQCMSGLLLFGKLKCMIIHQQVETQSRHRYRCLHSTMLYDYGLQEKLSTSTNKQHKKKIQSPRFTLVR